MIRLGPSWTFCLLDAPLGPRPIAMTDLGVLWKRRWFVVGATVLAAGLGYGRRS